MRSTKHRSFSFSPNGWRSALCRMSRLLNRDTLRLCPHALDLDVTAHPLLRVGFMPAKMARHSVYSHGCPTGVEAGETAGEHLFPAGDGHGGDRDRRTASACGSTGSGLAVPASPSQPNSRRGPVPTRTSACSISGGSGFGSRSLARLGSGSFCRTARWAVESARAGRWGRGPSICPLGSTACGLLSAWRSMRVEQEMTICSGLASQTVELALKSPGADGAFKCIAARDKDDKLVWGAGDGSGGSTIQGYLGYDMSWTAYWLLRWREAQLPGHERVLPRCQGLARFLIARQQPDGMFATFFDEAGNPLKDKLPYAIAETGPVALFLLKLYEADRQAGVPRCGQEGTGVSRQGGDSPSASGTISRRSGVAVRAGSASTRVRGNGRPTIWPWVRL